MLKASTIVCAIDMSAASRQNLPVAAKMAANRGAKLVLVHPVHFHNWHIYSVMTYSPKHEAVAIAGRVKRFARDIMNLTPQVKWELRVEAGEPKALIEAVAEETGAELVLSTRRRGRLEVLKSSVLIAPPAPAAEAVKTAEPSAPVAETVKAAEPPAEAVKTPEPELAFRPIAPAAESHHGAAR